MNKRKVEALIPAALEVLDKDICGLKADDGSIPKVYRAYISSFGASVIMGNLKAAVAFFTSDTDSTKGSRDKLICAMHYVLNNDSPSRPDAKTITNQLLGITDKKKLNQLKEDYINASLAIKLALNAFDLKKED